MRPVIPNFKTVIAMVMMLLAVALFARAGICETSETSQGPPPEEETTNGLIPQVDRTQAQISRGVVFTALWFDSFFQDETYEVERNNTHLRIRMDAFQESGEPAEFNFTPRLRLVLPYLQKKVHLEIMGSADEDFEFEDTRESPEAKQTSPSPKAPSSATLRYFIQSRDTFNLSLAAGAYYDDGPQLHFGPRSRVSFPLWLWETTYTQWFRWLTNDGFETESRFDLDYELRNQLLFRTRLSGEWGDKDDEFVHTLRFMLYHRLSNQQVLEYEWNNIFTNRPNHRIEETNLRVRYRQRIWRDWLFAEVAPQLSFPRDNDFKRTPGILFRLESFFGFLD